jgi:hypothetical protein
VLVAVRLHALEERLRIVQHRRARLHLERSICAARQHWMLIQRMVIGDGQGLISGVPQPETASHGMVSI